MNKNEIQVLILVLVFSLSTISLAVNIPPAYNVDTLSECNNPTVSLAIKVPYENETYNTSSLTAPLDACVMITLINADIYIHTFTITNVSYFNIFGGTGTVSSNNFMTPNASKTFTYFSSAPNDNLTEKGTFIISNTPASTSKQKSVTISEKNSMTTTAQKKTTPGFLVFVTMLSFGVIVVLKRKKGNKF